MGKGESIGVLYIHKTERQLVDLHFNPTAQPLPPGMMPRSTSTSSNLTLADKRKSILSIDGALDAMKAKDMWKGLKGVANPPDQVEAARKRGESKYPAIRYRGANDSG